MAAWRCRPEHASVPTRSSSPSSMCRKVPDLLEGYRRLSSIDISKRGRDDHESEHAGSGRPQTRSVPGEKDQVVRPPKQRLDGGPEPWPNRCSTRSSTPLLGIKESTWRMATAGKVTGSSIPGRTECDGDSQQSAMGGRSSVRQARGRASPLDGLRLEDRALGQGDVYDPRQAVRSACDVRSGRAWRSGKL